MKNQIDQEVLKIGIIVQARVGSSRLPNKIVLKFFNDDSILDIILNKFENEYFHPFVKILATSTNEKDNHLKAYAIKNNFTFFQGSENDVLTRFIDAAENHNLTHILRVCADNPFLDVDYIKLIIEKTFHIYHNKKGTVDYLSFKDHKDIPTIRTHLGLFTEIVSLRALKKANYETSDNFFHEHVTNYIYENEQDFIIKLMRVPKILHNREDIRFTVDDIDDFNNLLDLYQVAKSKKISSLYDLISFLDKKENESYKIKMIENIKKYKK